MTRPDPTTPARPAGPHERGRNLLLDRRFPAAMADILRHAPPRPVLELGAGDGAVTRALLALDRPLTAVEIDAASVRRLRRRFGGRVTVHHADLLRFQLTGPHDVVSNVPFGITTPVLRHLMPQSDWRTGVLLVQWEVARKRAAVGGTTMLTAAWWPWFTFELGPRVPAAAFAPAPSVDGGVLVVRRRGQQLVTEQERPAYQRLVRAVFTGRGAGLAGVLDTHLPRRGTRRWLTSRGLPAAALPRELDAADWVSLHELVRDRR